VTGTGRDDPGRQEQRDRARNLVRATIAWNAVEAVVALIAGVTAGSIALVGFGLDALVEFAAAGVALWYLAGADREREHIAQRLIALSFGALAAYVAVDAVRHLLTGSHPESSIPGIAIAAASLVVMPLLAVSKRRLALALGSATLAAEAAETALCAWLSAVLLAGLTLRTAAGWWWADPVAGLVIAALAVREGVEAWRVEEEGEP
jgi:divalent metal cation (Fe/Co/Zn/Cd) transporter